MESIRQFFSYMNDIDFQYVVLRNWDELPYDITLGEHSDLDILVADFNHWCEIFPQAHAEFKYPRVRMKVPIDDSYIYVDVRHLGDDYYPLDFEKAILQTRELNPRGFYTPDPLHHRIALAYHAVHHKGSISEDYTKYLGDAKIEDLLEALKSSNVGWIEPKDKSVGRFNPYWKGATAIVSKEDNNVIKKQVGYNVFDLISNEYRILSKLDSIHFPKTCGIKDGSIIIEDCGEHLNTTNIPFDWTHQLENILNELRDNKLMHRDISLNNLMVKDGIIKLIDFGWAKYVGEVEQVEPPSCLGYPNKPTDGFSDSYSMRCVSKQIAYMMEEIEA